MSIVTLDQTAIAVDMTADAREVTLVSATGVAAGHIIVVDREAMRVRGGYVSGTVVPVTRGIGGSAATPHETGATAFVGEPREFYQDNPSGKADTDLEYALPHINLRTGQRFDIAGNTWYEIQPGAEGDTQTLTPDNADEPGVNMILPATKTVLVGLNVTGVNDFITLPALADVPDGHTVRVVSNAAGHEVRTPAGTDEEINSENSDGTKEYAIAAAHEIHYFTKINGTIGWMGQGFTAIGAVVTAVVPD
jgi:hypothetical protein